MTKPNTKREQATDVPTEWRRIVLEEDSEGNVRPVAVEPVHVTADSTKVGVKKPGDATSAETPTARSLSDGMPEEWQDVFRTQSKPIPTAPPSISLQEQGQDFAEKTMAGMSFPEFYEGPGSASQNNAEPTQRQEGMWENAGETHQSDAFPFSAPPGEPIPPPRHPALVVPDPDPQADLIAPPAGVLEPQASVNMEETTVASIYPEKTQTLTAEQARTLTEAHLSVRQQLIDRVEAPPYLSPPPGATPAPHASQQTNGATPSMSDAFQADDVLDEYTSVSADSVDDMTQLTAEDEIPGSVDNLPAQRENWPPAEDLPTSHSRGPGHKLLSQAEPDEDDDDYGEATQLALSPAEGGWDGTIRSAIPQPVTPVPPPVAPLAPPVAPPAPPIAPSAEARPPARVESAVEDAAVEDEPEEAPAVAESASQHTKSSSSTEEAPASPSAEVSSEHSAQAPWQQMLSLQQQVASQMSAVAEVVQAQLQGPNQALLQELLLFYDFIEFRLTALQHHNHDDDPRCLELFSVQARLLDLLTHQGITLMPVEELDIDPTCYRVMDERETSRPEEDGQISRILRQGFRHNNKIFRPAEVTMKRYVG